MQNIENIQNPNQIIILVRSGYTAAQKKANDKYRQKNRDKINEIARRSYYKRKAEKERLENLENLQKDSIVKKLGDPTL